MDCRTNFRIPRNAFYTRAEISACIDAVIAEKGLFELTWLRACPDSRPQELHCQAGELDYRVVKQAETLLTALSEEFKGLQATIAGKYGPYRLNLDIPGCDDMGGFFNVTLENGRISITDDPIV